MSADVFTVIFVVFMIISGLQLIGAIRELRQSKARMKQMWEEYEAEKRRITAEVSEKAKRTLYKKEVQQ